MLIAGNSCGGNNHRRDGPEPVKRLHDCFHLRTGRQLTITSDDALTNRWIPVIVVWILFVAIVTAKDRRLLAVTALPLDGPLPRIPSGTRIRFHVLVLNRTARADEVPVVRWVVSRIGTLLRAGPAIERIHVSGIETETSLIARSVVVVASAIGVECIVAAELRTSKRYHFGTAGKCARLEPFHKP